MELQVVRVSSQIVFLCRDQNIYVYLDTHSVQSQCQPASGTKEDASCRGLFGDVATHISLDHYSCVEVVSIVPRGTLRVELESQGLDVGQDVVDLEVGPSRRVSSLAGDDWRGDFRDHA